MRPRVYLDWNATAPLRPEARDAMVAAMDVLGNPSSVHAEGRAARALVERARAQVARLADAEPGEVVFTSGATEANAQALSGVGTVLYGGTEHDSVVRAAEAGAEAAVPLRLSAGGRIEPGQEALGRSDTGGGRTVLAVGGGCSETGVVQDIGALFADALARGQEPHCDVTQRVGRLPFSFAASGAATAAMSAHKIGGPKGVGALIVRGGVERRPLLHGGGQELGRRSGTENLPGIAGFGAAAEAALRDLEAGLWDRVAKLRNILEERLEAAAPDTIFMGRNADRLPNTACFASPGWRGETQVMQLDLAGFGVSAGSACSSGKVRQSRVLAAMGLDDETAGSAIRVSIGPATPEAEIMAFAAEWEGLYRRRRQRAA